MSVIQRDEHTGHATTGHEWNGITELNTPVPSVVWFFLSLAVTTAAIMWVLLPAFPLGTTYTRGYLGVDQRNTVEQALMHAQNEREAWLREIADTPPTDIRQNQVLMSSIRRAGKTLFQDNCAVCHGMEANGGSGFPSLIDGAWLWGGDMSAIEETLRVGINSGHEETRSAEMPAFGRDGILEENEIENAIAYVQSLSQPDAKNDRPSMIAEGRAIFEENCSACHGETATGSTDMGAPDLTDQHWIYGGDVASLRQTLWQGRKGHMPHWEERLTEADRRLLAIYIQDLGSAAKSRNEP